MPEINFFTEEIDFYLPKPDAVKAWLIHVIEDERKVLQDLNFVFTSDNYLLNINLKYLKHNDYTDIITFDYSDIVDEIEGEIYISIDRIKENSKRFNESFINELHRVMVHGVLHLAGYNDQSDREKQEMRNYENHYLALREE